MRLQMTIQQELDEERVGADGTRERLVVRRHVCSELGVRREPETTCRRSVPFCSSAVLDPRVGHTTDVLSPLISVLCHSD